MTEEKDKDSSVNITAIEEAGIKQLTVQLEKQVKVVKGEGKEWLDSLDDATKLRFLRGHKLNLKEAQTFLEDAAKWRHEYGTDSVVEDWQKDESKEAKLLRKYFPMGCPGLDNRGRPIQFLRLAMVDFTSLEKLVGLDKMVKHTIHLFEIALRQNRWGEFIMLVDLGGDADNSKNVLKLSNISSWLRSAMNYIKALAKVIDPFYPETFFRVFFVRAPMYVTGMYNTMSEQLPESTRKKVEIINSTQIVKKLKDYIPATSLPEGLGGGSKEEIPKGGNLTKEELESA